MKTTLSMFAAGAVALSAAQAAQAAHLVEFDTPGDTEGFIDFMDRVAGDTVAGGVYSGTTTSGDAQLRRFRDGNGDNFSFEVGEYDTLEFRLLVDFVNDDPTTYTVVFYESEGDANGAVSGNIVSVTGDLGPDNTFVDYSIDLNALDFSPIGTGVIEGYRIDPGNLPASIGNTFQLDYVRLTNVPEPTSLAALGLGGLAMLRRRR